MDFYTHFNDAQRLADSIDDWDVDSFNWKKAYVAAAFAAIAYEEVPQFELKRSKRAKLIPCDRYQAHVSRWEVEQRRATVRDLDTGIQVEVIVRGGALVTLSRLSRVIFVSFRGTTLSFADFKADLDFRKVRYHSGFGESARLHRGFFDAVLECFDEVVERLRTLNVGAQVPVYVTGHSLGGAMAAIFHAKVDESNFHPFRHRRHHQIPSATSCYSFGMPRYGDTSAKSLLPQPYHTFNELDAVPTLPPKLLGFADSANERCLNAIPDVLPVLNKGDLGLRSAKGIATILGISDHRMERYVERTNVMRNK
ncbi:MAG: lipase family protein [Rhizobiales bacterium]|nr:lipase family protein [Hyphomicrobiales bacterium]